MRSLSAPNVCVGRKTQHLRIYIRNETNNTARSAHITQIIRIDSYGTIQHVLSCMCCATRYYDVTRCEAHSGTRNYINHTHTCTERALYTPADKHETHTYTHTHTYREPPAQQQSSVAATTTTPSTHHRFSFGSVALSFLRVGGVCVDVPIEALLLALKYACCGGDVMSNMLNTLAYQRLRWGGAKGLSVSPNQAGRIAVYGSSGSADTICRCARCWGGA